MFIRLFTNIRLKFAKYIRENAFKIIIILNIQYILIKNLRLHKWKNRKDKYFNDYTKRYIYKKR